VLLLGQAEREDRAFAEQVRCAASEFGLLGINGLDFVARDGIPYPIEVNPRWSATRRTAIAAAPSRSATSRA